MSSLSSGQVKPVSGPYLLEATYRSMGQDEKRGAPLVA